VKHVKNSGWILLAAILGYLCFVLPVYLTNNYVQTDESTRILQFLQLPKVKHGTPLPAIALLILGFILGLLKPKKWIVLGLSTAGLFVVNTIVELIAIPNSHNLLGLEIVGYLLLSIPACIGAFVGQRINKWYKNNKGIQKNVDLQ
jgi:hypothetical protein